jgi:hypothetical protein
MHGIKNCNALPKLIGLLKHSNVQKVEMVVDQNIPKNVWKLIEETLVETSIAVNSVTWGTGTYEGNVSAVQGALD